MSSPYPSLVIKASADRLGRVPTEPVGQPPDTVRQLIMVAVLVVLLVGMSRFNLPGWIVPVGVLAAAALLKAREKKASS